jgi:hypothetical protein
MERSRQPDDKLLTSADSRLFRSRPMSLRLSLGLWSLRTMRMRCVWRLRGSARLCSSRQKTRVLADSRRKA